MMKKIFRKMSPVLVISVLTIVMSMTVWADDSATKIPTNGNCGKHATWSYDKKTKTLTISGEGEIHGRADWENLYIKKAVIKDGITKIGGYSFSYLSYLEKVSIPKSVKVIGRSAFRSTALKSITISSHVKDIKPSAFYGCGELEKVCWGAKKIPSYTFYECTSLSQIKLKGKLQSIGSEAFYGTAIKKFKMPNTVKQIGSNVFEKCKKLEDVKLSSKIKVIPKDVFSDTPRLKSLTIPNSVKTINTYAFRNSYIEKIVIPDSVNNIRKRAFENAKGLKTVELSNNISTIQDETFANCKNLRQIKFGQKISTIGEAAFSGCKSLQSIVIPGSIKNIEYEAFKNCGFETVTLGEGVKNVDFWAFSNCAKLKSISISSTVSTFQSNALSSCPSLNGIVVAQNNEKYKIVEDCLVKKDTEELLVIPGGKTGTFTIPKEVKKINSEALNGCSKITAYSAGTNTNFKTIDGMLVDKTGTILVACPQGRTGTITVPKGIKTIGTSAFQYSKASNIILPNTVTALDSCAFEYCNNIKEITIPGSIYQISEACFWGCENLNKVTVENGVSRIWRNAFYGCGKLKKITLPNSLTYIHKTAFSDCNYKLKLYCKKNSLAMAYATKYYFSYKLI